VVEDKKKQEKHKRMGQQRSNKDGPTTTTTTHIHTFGLSQARKTSEAVLGRGHFRNRGGGSRRLGCSGHGGW